MTHIQRKVQSLPQSENIQELGLRLAFEAGYIACEQGKNYHSAMHEFIETLRGKHVTQQEQSNSL